MIRRFIPLILLICMGPAYANARAEENTCTVRYLSAEHVYLDAGSSQGLVAGMKVSLVREGKVFAELKVVFSAGHSASCQVVYRQGEIKAGDTGLFEPVVDLSTAPIVVVADSIPPPRKRGIRVSAQSVQVAQRLKMRGSIASQWGLSRDGTDRDLQTDLLSIPFRIRIENPGQNWILQARGSFRQITRRGFSASTPATEWRNRIREVALLRQNHQLAWNFALGRISTRATGSVGPFDGVNVSRSLGRNLRLGSFWGCSPRWEDYSFSTADQVSGLFLQMQRYRPGGTRLDILVSGVGRYHLGELSREYLVLTSTWSNASGLSLLQSSELDINRKWRRDTAAVSAVTLSSLALTGRYRLNRRYSVNFGYDDRQTVRTWETRSLPDSLFRDAGRRGVRAGFTVRFNRGRSLNLRASVRSDARTGEDTKLWNGRLYLPDFPVAGLDLDASARGFSGPWLSGFSPVVGVGKSSRSGLGLRVEGGHYAYTDRNWNEGRGDDWLKILVSKALLRRWSLAADFRKDWGDDIRGQRWFLEMRHRF